MSMLKGNASIRQLNEKKTVLNTDTDAKLCLVLI